MTVGDFFRAMFGVTKAIAKPAPTNRATPTVAVGLAAVLAVSTPFVSGLEGFTNPHTVAGQVVSVAIHQSIDPSGVYTYCQGLTNYDDKTVRPGQKFTKPECDKLFTAALEKYYGYLKRQIPNIDKYPVSFQAAMLSATYNLGEGNIAKSSMKRYALNGEPKKACDALMLYTKANGKVLKGLVNRRTAERKLCLQDL